MSGDRADPRWRALIEAAPVALVVLDARGEIVEANAAADSLLGGGRDRPLGGAFDALIAREDRDDVAAALSKVVMGTAPAACLDGIGVGGTTATLHAAPLEGEDDGAVCVWLLAAADPRVDPDLLQAQKLQALGQLAGGVAHDFNNLLTAILGFTDLLLTRPLVEADRADLEQIRRNARRGSRLVGQLLAFSRRQPQQPVTLAANAALGDLMKMLGRLLGETVELVLERAADPGMIRMDPGHFDQMIINLAVNARDAMPGGGQLTIATRDVPDGLVEIEVADTGVGMPKEILGDIFDPFFTTKGPRADGGGGTGLGLSTVYGIVRQAGGTIDVDSAPGRGTTFTVQLPAVSRDAATEAEPAGLAPAPPAAAGATILLVEDEDPVRQFAARALAARGHTVLEAESGETALDLLGELAVPGGRDDGGRLDLLVSDVVMPGVDGYTLSRLVREERPDLKVVLMSGYTDDALAPGLADDPHIRFLAKPFTLAQLADTVAATLAER